MEITASAKQLALDRSIWLLLAVNIAALGVAHWKQWPMAELLFLYWGQSIAIGLSYVLGVLTLDKYSTGAFTIKKNFTGERRPATRWDVVWGFIMMYGLVHTFYLVFLVFALLKTGKEPRLDIWFWLLVCAFALNHYWSCWYNRARDREATPDISKLTTTPFIRVIPMHLMICIGAFVGQSLLLFAALKIFADIGMHMVEQAQLQKIRQTQT